MNRISKFLMRIFHLEDVILVPQTKKQWELQFSNGRWDRLQEGQSNTIKIAQLILDFVQTKSERVRVLDVGCGNGGLARLIAHAVDYTGIDIAESAIVSARKVVSYGEFITCDAMCPPANLGMFDILIFNELLYYIDPRIVLPRYRMYANSDTQVYISVVRFWRSWFLWRRIKQSLRLTKLFVVRDARHCWDIATCTYI